MNVADFVANDGERQPIMVRSRDVAAFVSLRHGENRGCRPQRP
jgi:hypothetical protein